MKDDRKKRLLCLFFLHICSVFVCTQVQEACSLYGENEGRQREKAALLILPLYMQCVCMCARRCKKRAASMVKMKDNREKRLLCLFFFYICSVFVCTQVQEACSLYGEGEEQQGDTAALLIPPRPVPPHPHLLSSSEGMLGLVFAAEEEGVVVQQQQQQQQQRHDQQQQHHQPQQQQQQQQQQELPTPHPTLPHSLQQPQGLGSHEHPQRLSGPPAMGEAVATASAVQQANSVVQLLKARSSLGRGTRSLPPLHLMVAAAGARV